MPQTFWISTGTSRKETSWKNVELTWDEIAKRLEKTVVTPETLKEYLAFDKSLQDERKDVGGFVGGTIAGGRRKKGSVTSRSLLTLDVDFAKMDFWEDFQALFSHAAFVYGTHKHYDQHPRFRLVMPLLREVHADEYEAIGRWVASMIDIEVFDPTTFQAERLMYWPSTPKDQTYYFRRQVGKILDPDKVLAQYRDWKDQSQWAYSQKIEKENQEKIKVKKQADPLLKTGLIGTFCRVYSITECLEDGGLLEGIYAATEQEDRFTYLAGSTFGGLIVYEDKFAYSHHSSDPISEKLVNAWDLVRLHKFGDLDKEVTGKTPNGKRPSFKAMSEFARGDERVREEMAAEALHKAKTQWFVEELEAEPVAAEDWEFLKEMERDKTGFVTSYHNIGLILDRDPRIKGRIRFNELTRRMEVTAKMPWDRARRYPRAWTDDDWGQMRALMGKGPYILLRTPKLEDCMFAVKENNRFHPIQAYLKGLEWDGEERVNNLLEDYMGCESSGYIQAVTRKTLVGAVARAMRPGCKFDYVLTLVGKQGIGKSTLIKKLGKDWFSDTFNFNMLKGKEAFEQIQGRWIIEIGEMAGLRKAEIEAAKGFISSVEDSYRPVYGRETVTQARGCIFIGSSNNGQFLKKINHGNRRFWPADCQEGATVKSVWNDLDESEVDQIWAEAYCMYMAGETLDLDAETELEALRIQEAHEEIDDVAGIIGQYLDTKIPASWDEKTTAERIAYFQYMDSLSEEGTERRDKISGAEIWVECLKKNKGDMNNNNTKFIHDIMKNMPGWLPCKSKLQFSQYGHLVGYVRGIGKYSTYAAKKERGNESGNDKK